MKNFRLNGLVLLLMVGVSSQVHSSKSINQSDLHKSKVQVKINTKLIEANHDRLTILLPGLQSFREDLITSPRIIPAPVYSETVQYLRLCKDQSKPQWVACERSYSFGDVGPHGGFVFYTDPGGYHGLEASKLVLGTATWSCKTNDLSGANGELPYEGLANNSILKSIKCDSKVGKPVPTMIDLVSNHKINGYEGWFIPARVTLVMMQRRLALTDIAPKNNVTDIVWSSTEALPTKAFVVDLSSGATLKLNKDLNPNLKNSAQVWPIHKF